MTRRGHLNGVAYWLPSIRDTWGEAKACPIKIPQITCTNCFTLLQLVHEHFTTFILVRIRCFGGGFANPFPDVSPPYTFFLLNGDIELNRNRQLLGAFGHSYGPTETFL